MTQVEPLVVPADLPAIVASLDEDRARIERELAEIDLLVQQARIEAGRHETRRAQAAERLEALDLRSPTAAADARELSLQLATSTKRATLMEAQLDILEAKQKTLNRFVGRMREVSAAVAAVASSGPAASGANGSAMPAALSRAVLGAQEDLRRDIARQMHDGPAQSLANVALQAEIVQRLITRDPGQAQAEVGQLIKMVQHALEATKTFIFDVRPMVLDDLGIVPTLRRAARDRGRRAAISITFDSVGADRRLPRETESALFRVLDDALVAYLATRPVSVSVRLDWTDDEVRASVQVHRNADPLDEVAPEVAAAAAASGGEMPPALAQMISQQESDQAADAAASAAARAEARSLPAATWRDIEERARSVGLTVTLSHEGQLLEATAPLHT